MKKNEVRKTLKDYVEHLTKSMESYVPGQITSEWSCSSLKSTDDTEITDRSCTDSESNDELRYLCGKLNSHFCECVTYNGANLGIFFGVLCTNLLGYSMALKKNNQQKAEDIKERMFNHISKIN